MRSARNANSDEFSQALLKNPVVEMTSSNVATPASNAPLAFAAKLTPLTAQVEPAVEAPQVDPAQDPNAAPVTSSGPETTPQSPARNHDARLSDVPEKEEPAAPVAMSAAASSYTGGFSHSFQDASQQSTAPATTADTKTPTTFGTVAESMRASESIAIANTQPATTASNNPVQSITMRISPPNGHADMPVVDLQVSSRGGEIHVAVRTSDAQLESAMRQDLGALSSSLDRAGYRAETYVPRDAAHELGFTAAQSTSSGSQDNRDSSHSQQDFTGRDSSGSHSGRQQQGRQNQGQNQGQNQRFRNWIFQMEKQ